MAKALVFTRRIFCGRYFTPSAACAPPYLLAPRTNSGSTYEGSTSSSNRECFLRHASDDRFHESGQRLVHLGSQRHATFSHLVSTAQFSDRYTRLKISVSDGWGISRHHSARDRGYPDSTSKIMMRDQLHRASQSTQQTGLPALSERLSKFLLFGKLILKNSSNS